MRTATLVALLVVGLAVSPWLPSPLAPVRPATAAEVTVFSEDFEGAFPGAAWTVGDTSPVSGFDYWGASTARANSGTRSAWCAQVGDQGGTPNPVLGTYDNSMIPAFMSFRSPDLSAYTSVYIQFALWLQVETCCDRLDLVAGPVGGPYTLLTWWDVNTAGWALQNVTIPGTTREISFNFRSDGTTVFEGAYVDDVRLIGYSPTPPDTEPPTIAHTPVASAPSGQPIDITATITDNVGVTAATLHYQDVGGGGFTAVAMTEETPDNYVAQIPAQGPGTAHYFLEATDGTNTAFLPTNGLTSPFAVTITAPDTTPPLIVHVPVTDGLVGEPIPIPASVTDDTIVGSVVVRYKAVGQSTFVPLAMTGVGSSYAATIPAQSAAGTLQYYIEATDGASNVAYAPGTGLSAPYSVSVAEASIPPAPPPWILIAFLLALIVGVGIWGMIAARRRRRQGPPVTEPMPSPEPEERVAPARVTPRASPPPAVEPAPDAWSTRGVCVVCGLVNEAGTVFCQRCGTRLAG